MCTKLCLCILHEYGFCFRFVLFENCKCDTMTQCNLHSPLYGRSYSCAVSVSANTQRSTHLTVHKTIESTSSRETSIQNTHTKYRLARNESQRKKVKIFSKQNFKHFKSIVRCVFASWHIDTVLRFIFVCCCCCFSLSHSPSLSHDNKYIVNTYPTVSEGKHQIEYPLLSFVPLLNVSIELCQWMEWTKCN